MSSKVSNIIKPVELTVFQAEVINSLLTHKSGNTVVFKDINVLSNIHKKVKSSIPPAIAPPAFPPAKDGEKYSEDELKAFQPAVDEWTKKNTERFESTVKLDLVDHEKLIIRNRLINAKFENDGEEFRNKVSGLATIFGIE